MSREIKFRAWYKPDLELGNFMKFETVYSNDTVMFEWNEKITNFPLTYDVATVLVDNDWIKEQYTGIKDKKGKEVYIGDLFKIKYDYNWKKEDYFEVVFSRKLGIILRNSKGRWFHLVDIIKHYEIVGNIHENEELLK